MTKRYRTKDGQHVFQFAFAPRDGRVEVFCLFHPSLEGRDPCPHKTHLFPSGRLCFVAGREPRDQHRAEKLAGQWAEYFIRYAKTGTIES